MSVVVTQVSREELLNRLAALQAIRAVIITYDLDEIEQEIEDTLYLLGDDS